MAISIPHRSEPARSPARSVLGGPEPRGRRAPLWTAGLAALVVLAAGFAGFGNSPFFRLRSIAVSGNQEVARGRIVALAHVADGQNVLWLDTRDIERRIETGPWIADAVVRRVFPSGLRIAIRERRAVAVIKGAGPPLLVAGDGTVLGEARGRARLPVVGSRGGETPAGAAAALAAIEPRLRSAVATARVDSGGEIQLGLLSGATVAWGPAGDDRDKAAALGAILEWAERESARLRRIDVRSPEAPTARPSGA